MLDHDHYGPFFDKSAKGYQNSSEIRRSKLSLAYKPSKLVKSKLQFKYSKNLTKKGKLSLGDAWLRLSKNTFGLQLGRMKQPFGLEQQTSSSQLLTIERSLPTIAFSPGRDFGLQLDQKRKNFSWAAGYFIERDTKHDFALSNFNLLKLNQVHTDDSGPNDIESATARVHFKQDINSPLNLYKSTIHLGTSISKQWLEGTKFQFKEQAEINSSDNILRSARFYANSKVDYQLDFAWVNHQSLLQAEAFSSQIEAVDGVLWRYSGAYVQLGYLQFASYQYKYGKIKRGIEHSYGWELVFRQSYLDLRDHAIGSESAVTLLGINLYLPPYLKLMLNISNPWISGDTVNTNHSGQAYSFRAQIDF